MALRGITRPSVRPRRDLDLRGSAESLALAALGALVTAVLLWSSYTGSVGTVLLVVGGCVAIPIAIARPLWAIGLAIALIPAGGFVVLPLGPVEIAPADAMFLLAGLSWPATRAVLGQPLIVHSRVTVPLAILLLAIVPGIIVATDVAAVVVRLVLWTALFFVVQAVAADAEPRHVRGLFLVLVATAALEGLIAVAAPGLGEATESIEDTGLRAQGTFDQPNILGQFQALALPAAVVLALQPSHVLRAAGVLGTVLIGAGALLSQSRGALAGVAGALVVLLILPQVRKLAAVGIVAVVGLVTAGSFGLLSVGLGDAGVAATQRFDAASTSGGGEDPRFDIWSRSLEIVQDHPWTGIGASNFPEVGPTYGLIDPATGDAFLHAHNLFLHAAVEFGIPGLLAFGWLAVALVLTGARAVRHPTAPVRAMAVGIAGAGAATAVGGIADDATGISFLTAVMAVLAGALIALCRDRDDSPVVAD